MKDRYLLALRPHFVIDGLLLAASALAIPRSQTRRQARRTISPIRISAPTGVPVSAEGS
jgi:hypothetical protein